MSPLRIKKAKSIQDISNDIDSNAYFLVFGYSGTSTDSLSKIRQEVSSDKISSKMRIVKNSCLKLALSSKLINISMEINKFISGQCLIISTNNLIEVCNLLGNSTLKSVLTFSFFFSKEEILDYELFNVALKHKSYTSLKSSFLSLLQSSPSKMISVLESYVKSRS